jgi:hypothetical protein
MSQIDNVKAVIAVTTTNGAAGTTLITSAAVDTLGFDSCLFLVPLGTIVAGAVTSIKVQQSSDDAASDTYDDLLGSNQTILDTDDDKLKYVDIVRIQKRYLKLLVTRGTSNATIGGVIALLYHGRGVKPFAQGAGVAGEAFIAPIEGTA